MLILGSKYGAASEGSKLDGVGYNSNEFVPKPSENGVALLRRDPAPEILLSDPNIARSAISVSPGKLKYRSIVLSYATSDIDVSDFNAGALAPRIAVDHSIRLYAEVAFAGIPEDCRPPIFATTHTHTGRLELNVIVPRWVKRGDGSLRSFNPDPPGPASLETFDALEDLLNARFTWSDPRDPARKKLVDLPNWVLKKKAAALRSGSTWQEDPRTIITRKLVKAFVAGEVRNRSEVLEWLGRANPRQNIIVHGAGPDHITIGAADAPPRERIRLRGLLFSEAFTSRSALKLSHKKAVADLVEQRKTLLANASERLQTAWTQRAAFNCSRYGLGNWPELPFDAAEFAKGPLPPRPMIIPAQRLCPLPNNRREKEPEYGRTRPYQRTVKPLATGTRVVAPGSIARPKTSCGVAVAKPEHQSAAGQDARTRGGSHPLDRFADILAGPAGPAAILTALVKRVRAALPRVVTLRLLDRVSVAIPAGLPADLINCTQSLEKLNVTLERLVQSAEIRRRNRSKTRSDLERDYATARTARRTRERGNGPDGKAGRGPRKLFAHRQAPSNLGESVDQSCTNGRTASGSEAGLQGTQRTPSTVRQENERDAGRLAGSGPVLGQRTKPRNRAALIKDVLKVCDAADPGAARSLRCIIEASAIVPEQGELHVWLGPQELWLLTASPRGLHAVSQLQGLWSEGPITEMEAKKDTSCTDPFEF